MPNPPVAADKFIPLTEISKATPHLPSRSIASWWRYTTHGLRGVKLQTRYVFGRLCTTVEWVEQFNDRINAAKGNPVPRPQTTKQRERENARAKKRLKEMGV